MQRCRPAMMSRRSAIPKSVVLRANRQIELDSSVIHTVDYVTGTLQPDHTGVDALFAHMWSVALTGAPKAKALELIEKYEPASRNRDGGAVGYVRLNGDVDTGIPIGMMHVVDGITHVQAGSERPAWDSVPAEEVSEANNKISFFANDAQAPALIRSGKRAVHRASSRFRRFIHASHRWAALAAHRRRQDR